MEELNERWENVYKLEKCDPPLEKHKTIKYDKYDSNKSYYDKIPIIFNDYITDVCTDGSDVLYNFGYPLSGKELVDKSKEIINNIISEFKSKYQIDDNNTNTKVLLFNINNFLEDRYRFNTQPPLSHRYTIGKIRTYIKNKDETLLKIRDEMEYYNSLSDEIKIKVGKELVSKAVIDTKALITLGDDIINLKIENRSLKEIIKNLTDILVTEKNKFIKFKYELPSRKGFFPPDI